jgi:hypothetical protein
MDAQGRTTAVLAVPSSKTGTGREVIDFNPGDVGIFLSRISGALPEAIRVVGSVIVNQNYDISQPASIGSRSSFGGNLELGIPLSLGIQAGCFVDTGMIADTTGDGRQDVRIDQELLNKANWGRLHVDVDNGLPLDVKLKLRFLDRAKRPLFDLPQASADTISVYAGILSGGDVQMPTLSQIRFDLTPAEIRRFNEVNLVALAVTLNTPAAGVVNFRSTDRIRVRVWIELSEQVNP